jgi:phosphoglycerate dehydrogenase-like enzyme
VSGLLISRPAWEALETRIRKAAAGTGLSIEPVLVPDDPDARLGDDDIARIEMAFFTFDTGERGTARSFFAAAQAAPNLKWMQTSNAGLDNPVFQRILAKGTRVSTASGSAAKPIAQTLIAGMLMLSRGFPRWMDGQRRHAWESHRGDEVPEDLEGQHMVVVGLGAIGCEIARLARAIGLEVTGVRRRPHDPSDPVDHVVPPARLHDLLPATDWLALACPLTDETRHLVGKRELAAVKAGARVLNIARGEVIDQDALIASLQSGHLGGAYLDVTTPEPLPAESPLWTLPNVIITPHNSAAARGNTGRVFDIYIDNVGRYARGERLRNEA